MTEITLPGGLLSLQSKHNYDIYIKCLMNDLTLKQ